MGLLFLLYASLLRSETVATAAKLLSAIASSVVFVELLLRYQHYREAAQRVREVLLRLDPIRQSGSKDDWVLAFLDYSSAVETAPMIFPGANKWNQKRLNQLFAERHG